MASNRFLLLLIGLFSTHLPKVQARNSDFWCKAEEREITASSTFDKLKKGMADCVGSDTLPSPVRLPSAGRQAAEWANKTLQQKSAEVFGALQLLQTRVQVAVNRTTLQCQRSLLTDLDRHIGAYLIRIKQAQNGTVTPSESIEQDRTSQTTLNGVLKRFKRLLSGKLEVLAVDLADVICKADWRT